MHVHCAGVADPLIAPCGAQQLLAGERCIRGAHQRVQQRKFLCGQGQLLATQRGFMPVGIKAKRANG